MDSIKKLIELFSDFPTIGPRTASRFVYYLLKQPKEKIEEITNAILDLKNKTKFCSFCFNPFEGESNLCPICSAYGRNKNLLCIVEKEQDLLSIENAKKYTGLYFILGGNVATMRKQDIGNLRIEELKERILNNSFSEIIIAVNSTPEGIATSGLVERTLKEIQNQNFKITHLAKGIPIGGELEYADQETLESALEGRK
jgi:recombination protein RecR